MSRASVSDEQAKVQREFELKTVRQRIAEIATREPSKAELNLARQNSELRDRAGRLFNENTILTEEVIRLRAELAAVRAAAGCPFGKTCEKCECQP